MKRLFFSAIISMLLCCGCEGLDGLQQPIKTDIDTVAIPPAGGQAVVFATNYSSWWLDNAACTDDSGSVKEFYSETGASIEMDWMKLTVPSQRKNCLYIELSENAMRHPRKIVIVMQSANAFKWLSVTQGSALLYSESALVDGENKVIPRSGR